MSWGREASSIEEQAAVTEAEWLACDDPMPMLVRLQNAASDRKLRLLTVAASRQIWHLLLDGSRAAALMLERYADGLVETTEYEDAWGRAEMECRMCATDSPDMTNYAIESVLISDPPTATSVAYALSTAAMAIGCAAALAAPEQDYDAEGEAGRLRAAVGLAHFVRCIFGNPFRRVTCAPTCVSSTALVLAEGIYRDRAFDRLPILADALEDAGCTDRAILDHCRQPGEHVRGCWVVDLVLEKS